MTTWTIDVELLWKDEPWPNKEVTLHYKTGVLSNFGASFSQEETTDEDGHASFEIEDEDDEYDGDAPVIITVYNHGKHEFGPYTLGGGGYTINMDSDTETNQIDF